MKRLLSRSPLVLWATLAVLVLIAGGYLGFHALFVKVGRSVEQPFSGPARHNDYYVLQRYLEARGLNVRIARSWPATLSPDLTVLWLSDDELPADVRTWLAAGGQLWSFRDPDAVRVADEWVATPWRGEEPADDDEASEDWCAAGCLVAAQFHYGDGCLTLVRAFGLSNETVSLGETPARIDALLRCPKRPASVLIVTSVGSPWFGQLLLLHASEALLAFGVLLTLSLWRAGKHFGPKQPPRIRERRQMLEHITAVGLLAGRVGLLPLLVAARRELRRQLLRRVPQGASLGDEALVAAVAAATNVSPKDVQRALLDPPGGGTADTLAIARAMQALWRKT